MTSDSKSSETPELFNLTRACNCYSDREPPPVMHCVAYFNFEDICKDLGKVQLPWCIKENSATTIQLLGIRQNNRLQLHILTILAIPKSCIRSPSCQLLLLSIPVGLHTQWTEPK